MTMVGIIGRVPQIAMVVNPTILESTTTVPTINNHGCQGLTSLMDYGREDFNRGCEHGPYKASRDSVHIYGLSQP